MKATDLIEYAGRKGYAIGRNKPGQYRYGYLEGGKQVEHSFDGDWPQFCAFVHNLPHRPCN